MPKPGHIPSAASLQLWTWGQGVGRYKGPTELFSRVRPWANVSRSEGQTIVYCGVGGYANALFFVLTKDPGV